MAVSEASPALIECGVGVIEFGPGRYITLCFDSLHERMDNEWMVTGVYMLIAQKGPRENGMESGSN